MLDDPPAALIMAEIECARVAGLTAGFAQKVAANALGIAEREMAEGPVFATAEHGRLVALLGPGDLPALNGALAAAIRRDAIDLEANDLITHLILTTLEKLAIDQPSYSGLLVLRSNLPAHPPSDGAL